MISREELIEKLNNTICDMQLMSVRQALDEIGENVGWDVVTVYCYYELEKQTKQLNRLLKQIIGDKNV